MKKLKLFSLLMLLFVGVTTMWGVNYEKLYDSGSFSSGVSDHGYTQNKTFTLANKQWKASVSQRASSVFYLGCNSNNASKGILNDNSDFSDIVTALRAEDSPYNNAYTTAHAYALLFANAYNDVTKITFAWDDANNAIQIYLFGYTGSAWTKLQKGAATSGSADSVVWTGDATNFTKFAIVARPGAAASTATSKTLRGGRFIIYKTATPAISGVPNEDIDFGSVKQYASLTDETFTLTGANLTDDLSLSIDNASGFTVDPTSITPNNGAVSQLITISHSTDVAGDFLGTLTISGGGLAASASVDLVLEVTPRYVITKVENGGGITLSPNVTYAEEDDEITITANSPDGSHEGKGAIKVIQTGEDPEVDVTELVYVAGTGILTMPDFDITISATYAEKTTPSVGTSPSSLDFGSPKKGASIDAKTFELTGAALTAGTLTLSAPSGFTVSPTSIPVAAGTLSAQTITVTPNTSAAGTFNGNISITGGGLTSAAIVSLSMTVQETYSVDWYVNNVKANSQTDIAGTAVEIPSNPTPTGDCSEKVFLGWGKKNVNGEQDLINTAGLEIFSKDTAFYAVFATEDSPYIPAGYKLSTEAPAIGDGTVVVAVRSGSTYYAIGTNGSASEITLENGVISSSTGKVWTLESATTGLYYNTGSDNYIHMNSKTFGVAGTTTNGDISCISNGDGSYKFYGNNQSRYLTYGGSFGVSSNVSEATAVYIFKHADAIAAVYSDTVTICPACAEVTFTKVGEGNGNTFTLLRKGKEASSAKTCEDVTIAVEFTVATGYELTNFAVSGIEGASYNATDKEISIPEDADGELTVTATFSEINYTVTMAQTGDASATLSDDQTNKHYQEQITISTNEPEGFAFVRWTASTSVTFANAYAKSTTFTMPNSNITVTATFAKVYSVAEAIAEINKDTETPIAGVVVEGYVIADVTATSKGAITYNIKDVDANGFLTGTQFQVYSGKNLKNADFAKGSGVEIGAKARIYGTMSYYSSGSLYQLNGGNYLVAYDAGTYAGVVVYGDADITEYDKGDAFEFDGLNAKDAWSNGYAQTISETLTWTANPTNVNEDGTIQVKASYEENEQTYESEWYDVDVTVKTYAVTFSAPQNGTLVVTDFAADTAIVSGAMFPKGTKLTVTATPDSNYELASLTANGDDIATDKEFTISNEDVVVVATFSQATALDNTEVGGKAVKLLRNGILLIEKNGHTYNAMGQLIK